MNYVPSNELALADYSLGDVISTSRLHPATRPYLLDTIGDLSAVEVGKMHRLAILQMVQMALPADKFEIEDINTATDVIRDALVRNGFGFTFGDLGLAQLLKLLNTKPDPDHYQEVCRALHKIPAVAKAIERTDGQWIFLDHDGSIHIPETVRYVRRLNSGLRLWWKLNYVDSGVRSLEEIEPQHTVRPQHREDYYEAIVRAAAGKQSTHAIKGNSTRTKNGICITLSVDGSNNILNNVFVLDRMAMVGNSNFGTIVTCGPISKIVQGSNNQLSYRQVRWSEACRMYDLIWE